MRKILIFIICFSLILGVVGCSEKLPEGIENKEFYKDMVNSIKVYEKHLKSKEPILDNNSNYINKNDEKILEKTLIYANEKLTEKEQRIYIIVNSLFIYIDTYCSTSNEDIQTLNVAKEQISKLSKELFNLLDLDMNVDELLK
ncbi:hypothetical protein [Brassicibacter mesophilus]|uniref:hypothetical protein n=1 Tax=Brassicibacter mesophilus TaxID=745119 RepID=UPI003D24AE97